MTLIIQPIYSLSSIIQTLRSSKLLNDLSYSAFSYPSSYNFIVNYPFAFYLQNSPSLSQSTYTTFKSFHSFYYKNSAINFLLYKALEF